VECAHSKIWIDCITVQTLYEDALAYQKVISRLQETAKSLTKADDPSADVNDIVMAYQQLCTSAEVASNGLFSFI